MSRSLAADLGVVQTPEGNERASGNMGLTLLLLTGYAGTAAVLIWAGRWAGGLWKPTMLHSRGSAMTVRIVGALLALAGLWSLNVVAFNVWAGGGPDVAHQAIYIKRATWALLAASVLFLASGALWRWASGRVNSTLPRPGA